MNSSARKGIGSLKDGSMIDCYDFLDIFFVSYVLGLKEGAARVVS